jgi:hypothetical protein
MPMELPSLQHLEDLDVIEGHVIDVDFDAMTAFDVLDRAFDDGQVAQAQEVHLQQSELLDGAGLVLGDDRRVLARTVWSGLALDRRVLEDRFLGDHHRSRVDTVLTALVDEALGHVDGVLHLRVALIERS